MQTKKMHLKTPGTGTTTGVKSFPVGYYQLHRSRLSVLAAVVGIMSAVLLVACSAVPATGNGTTHHRCAVPGGLLSRECRGTRGRLDARDRAQQEGSLVPPGSDRGHPSPAGASPHLRSAPVRHHRNDTRRVLRGHNQLLDEPRILSAARRSAPLAARHARARPTRSEI